MTVQINVNLQIVPPGSYYFKVFGKTEEVTELHAKRKLLWPYEFPPYSGSIRSPVTIWGTAPTTMKSD